MRELAAAYEGLEGDLSDPQAVARHRAHVLERTRPQADLLAALLPPGARVLEVGTGNGRLLVELARRGALTAGDGLDLAGSRVAFARRWAADEGLAGLRFRRADALADPLGTGHDALVCITGVLQYFDAFRAGAAAELLRRLRSAAADGAVLLLELYRHRREQALAQAGGGTARLWHELPPDDPWRFYLSDLAWDPGAGVMTHRKTFVHRTTGAVDEGRAEALRLYGDDELRTLLSGTGFADVALRDGWDGAGDGEVLVVTARAA